MVVAGLQRDVGRRSSGGYAPRLRIGDCHLLGVQPPDVVVPPLSDDAAVPDENAADHRVRHHSVTPQLRELERPAHESSTVDHSNRAHEPALSS